ncbi:DUF4160 domain-containing protein [Xylophilus ampelinus]|uniref:DUF4160 domain-containing protein n=1 Tax=Xylophilus ampelinus TaxID=54067 RepID=UPI000D7C255C|nr:DUF4160 domain-containing protein [Xylophilus ampelinus]MCS4510676.1 DUF4160 domain-containing protein [Xylophilus ampelinus]
MKQWTIEVEEDVANELEYSLDQGGMLDDDDIDELRRLGVVVAPGAQNLLEHLVRPSGQFKVQIFSDEHPPPHFSVTYSGETNCFRIDDCTPMYPHLLDKYYKRIRNWHSKNKQNLIDTWNNTRPTGCTVGAYRTRV